MPIGGTMLDIVDQLEKLDLKEILGYAIESEKAAQSFYLDMAKTAPGLAATRLENLAREEEKHEEIAREVYTKKFGDEPYTIPKGLPPLESSVDVDTVTSLIHALETAMKNENNAYRVYRYLANKVSEHKDLFKYLASMEKGHYDIVKAERDNYESRIIEKPSMRNMTPSEFWLEGFRV
jgi:rubrerythrin